MRHSSRGFSIIEVLAVIVIVGIVGFVGWRVYGAQENGSDAPEITSNESSEQQTVPEVSSNEDLEEAENYLNEQDIDSQLDTSEIDEALAE